MAYLDDRFRLTASRLVAIVLLACLALGVRAQAFVLSYVLQTVPVLAQAPVQEEEEHRHEAHGKAGATDARRRDRVPPPRRESAIRILTAWAASRGPVRSPAHIDLPDRECDLRNGLGAPLLC
jgi:hypothetical protein